MRNTKYITATYPNKMTKRIINRKMVDIPRICHLNT